MKELELTIRSKMMFGGVKDRKKKLILKQLPGGTMALFQKYEGGEQMKKLAKANEIHCNVRRTTQTQDANLTLRPVKIRRYSARMEKRVKT